jgi:hypothetical protein
MMGKEEVLCYLNLGNREASRSGQLTPAKEPQIPTACVDPALGMKRKIQVPAGI